MLNHAFGYDKAFDNEDLLKVAPHFNSMDGIQRAIIEQELYDVHFGICKHDNGKEQPLSLVAMHDKESLDDIGSYSTIKRFHHFEVSKHFGLSLTEFLNLPREITRLIFKLLAEEAREKAKSLPKPPPGLG